jgi:hypothetical protein
MSSLTNINNNSRVVNVGRTTPVAPGQQPAAKSIPVVLASDQTAIPVVEQNKVQSEVSLSLLGIPRSEVALGIFADVNTYDVNPTEWSSSPQYYNAAGGNGYGIKHLPNEAGALVEAPRDRKAVLTSKRFFRYQPGRVSAATFGVKTSVNDSHFARNPVIRKYGIFDNFDGYYWESKQSGQGDNFSVVRRTQSLLKFPGSPFGLTSEFLRKPDQTGASTPTVDVAIPFNQTDDYRSVGKEGTALKGKYFTREINELLKDSINLARDAFTDELADTSSALYQYYNNTLSTQTERDIYRDKCHRDAKFWLDMICMDLEWGGNAHTKINCKNYTTAVLNDSNAEEGLYTRLKANIAGAGTEVYAGTTSAVATRLGNASGTSGLLDIPITFFGNSGMSNKSTRISAYQAQTNGTANGAMSFGDKARIDTLLDTRKHYYSYFVSSFQRGTNVDTKDDYQTYVFQNNNLNALFMPTEETAGELNALVGAVLTSDGTGLSAGQYYPYAPGSTITVNSSGVTLSNTQATALNEFYLNIKYKCVRDLEYIINGYKNDLSGGGNAETLYNASMYYKASGLSIYTQTAAGITQEIAKHTHLKDWIVSDLNDATLQLGSNASSAVSRLTAIGNGLATIIIDNFTTETTQGVELGDRGFAGNLIALRDGLLMVHAAVNDPNLLKEVEQIKILPGDAPVSSEPTRFTMTKGIVTFGQKVRIVTTATQNNFATANNITKLDIAGGNVTITPVEAPYDQIYTVSRVYGPTGREFSLQNQAGEDIHAYRSSSLCPDEMFVETVVPFIGDVKYDPAVYRTDNSTRPDKTIQQLDGSNAPNVTITENTDPFPVGMQWPLRYSSSTQLTDVTASYLGHIDTSLAPTSDIDIVKIRQQYDDINFDPEYINWIKNNVKPEFWGVYEYRIPRSRFSHDKLDGKTSKRVYSDLATGNTGVVRPGMEVLDEDGVWTDAVSEYEFDFTKVTMLKIEFSWYGAVGALFLAYVPIGNGEARWVRVHHLRASNQLKIASLGNATLPITYNVWGGGSPDTLGDGETSTHTYGISESHHIVKYGASYYIDGGDRGTVRLYSHNNNDVVASHGKQWVVNQSSANGGVSLDLSTGIASIDLSGVSTTQNAVAGDRTDMPADLVYFMGAGIKTDNPIDGGIKVVWVDGDVLTLSQQPAGSGLTLIPDRADLVYGLETKDVIISTLEKNPVRNRVQVYPTKMSTANLGSKPVRLRMKRTPIFQTLTQCTGTLQLNADYTVTPNNLPLPVTGGSSGYMDNGEDVYGWFQGVIGDVDKETVFGRLYKKLNEYYFEVLQSFDSTIVLNNNGYFLADKRFNRDSTATDGAVETTTAETKRLVPLADTLTSVNAVNDTIVPIPNTGSNVATLYLQPSGTEQVDLDTYFDYNKEYLSYPLTDQAETLYFAVDLDGAVKEDAEVAIGLTWEEQ